MTETPCSVDADAAVLRSLTGGLLMHFLHAVVGVLAVIGSVPAAVAQEAQLSPPQIEARLMLRELVAFRTVAGQGQMLPTAQYLSAEFQKAGFKPEEIEIATVEGSASLLVRYRGSHSSKKAPVLFLTHMDVVDAQPEEWKHDPWKLTEFEGGFFGRGVVDNKFGLLALTQAFIRLKREGFVPDRELVLVVSGDEETGGNVTARPLAERLKGAAFAINSDAGGGFRSDDGTAGSYFIQTAEKTYATFEIAARNKGGHSSSPRPDNAIYELSAALANISGLRFPVRWNATTIDGFEGLAPMLEGDVAKAVSQFVGAPGDLQAIKVMEQEPWLNRELRTTCVATMFRAGQVENSLPVSATATINCRIFPGDAVSWVKEELVKSVANPSLTVTLLGNPVDSLPSDIPVEVTAALKQVLAVRLPQAVVSQYMEGGGTDGAHFRRAGIATVGLGPLIGTSGAEYNFHGNDERLPIQAFVGGLDHYYLFIKALAGPAQ